MKREGILVPDYKSGRINIQFSCEEYYGGLHCGSTMVVWLEDRWVPTRIELNAAGWYLVGVRAETILGLKVRL